MLIRRKDFLAALTSEVRSIDFEVAALPAGDVAFRIRLRRTEWLDFRLTPDEAEKYAHRILDAVRKARGAAP